MTTFDFCKEMVYGKKHLSLLDFKKEEYDIYQEVTNLFGYPLNEGHSHQEEKYDLFTELIMLLL